MASYIFLGFFTKAKVGVAPANAPTVDVVNVDTNALVVTAGSPSAISALPGLYAYTYSGAAGLRLVAAFKTADATVDLQHLPSYTPTEITDNLDAAVSTRLATTGYTAPPAAATNAAAVRTELAAELARVDAPISDVPTNAELTSALAAADDAVLAAIADVPTNAELTSALAAADDAVLAAIADVPTVAEFEARTLAAADYVVVTDLPAAPAAAPTAAAVAGAVWDEAIAGHALAGSTGAALAAAGASSDPLLNLVPGAYASGTAGAALGNIAGATVTVVSPVAADGTAITLVYGDDYAAADNRALVFTALAGPVLTGGAVALRVQAGLGLVNLVGVVTGAHSCYIELTDVQVATIGVGAWAYDLEATLVTTANVVTLVTGYVTVAADVR